MIIFIKFSIKCTIFFWYKILCCKISLIKETSTYDLFDLTIVNVNAWSESRHAVTLPGAPLQVKTVFPLPLPWMTGMENYTKQVEIICQKLCKYDSKNAEKYKANCENYLQKINQEKQKYESELQKLNGEKKLCDRELLEKILSIVEKQEKLSPTDHKGGHFLYDNKSLMEKLHIKEKYLKKLCDNGYLGYSREGNKY